MDGVKGVAAPHVAVLLADTLDLIRQTFRSEDWLNLRTSHFRLLSAVPDDGLSITELAERLGMTKQGCGQLVTTLDVSGHLVVAVDGSDRRLRIVRRTGLGDLMVTAVEDRIEQIEQGWASQVGPQRYATFRQVMAELVAGSD